MIGQKLSEDWGQPVVVENRPGANTVLGAQQVARSAPDGYTLLMAIDSTLTMNQYLYRTPPYDPFNDFVPITLTAKTMQLLIVNAASDVRTLKELVAKAKARPGRLNYGAATPPSSRVICSTRPQASKPCSFPTTEARRWPTACSPKASISLSMGRRLPCP
jgi:tripartite-type tricarboxylate transporter receptor subunit TctC